MQSENTAERTPAQERAIQAWKDSTHDMFQAKNKWVKSRQKITPEQRTELTRRAREGESPKGLALEYGVSAAYVRNLRSGWANS